MCSIQLSPWFSTLNCGEQREQIFNMFAQVYDESRNAYLTRRASTRAGLPGLTDPSVLEGYQQKGADVSPDPMNHETTY